MNCNKMCAEYLFQQDKHYDTSFDTGDKVIQCGRHNDIFKLWLLWRAKVNGAGRWAVPPRSRADRGLRCRGSDGTEGRRHN